MHSMAGKSSTNSGAETKVAVVTVNYRTPDLALACVASLGGERRTLPSLKVVVVDGGSGDGSPVLLAKALDVAKYRDWVTFLQLPINGGFGWANNQAIQLLLSSHDPPSYVHLLNPDSEIEPGAVRLLVEYLEAHPRVAAVGSQLLELDGSWTGSAFSFPSIRGELSRGARTASVHRLLGIPPVAVKPETAAEVDWATGASVMFRVEALREVGLFDEGFFLYHEEIELMWRLRKAGWTIATEPRSRVRHVGGGSTGIHYRATSTAAEPRRPRYWYRSRSRYFALTRGWSVAALAYFSWIIGHAIWGVRRLLGLAPGAKPFEHQLRDHLANSFPRPHDLVSAVASADSRRGAKPAWMRNRWL